MCGIIGYIGDKNASEILIEGLKKLEYRGYDSAGIATLHNERRYISKTIDGVETLEQLPGNIGIGHTRWATHGAVTVENAHPHYTENVTIVHNGIIENYKELRAELDSPFSPTSILLMSETDSEILAHLFEYDIYYTHIIGKGLEKIKGTYAIAAINRYEPEMIVCAKQFSPLIIGIGKNENYVASDPIALPTDKVIHLQDGDFAIIYRDKVVINGETVSGKTAFVQPEIANKGKYEMYMLKEMWEQPEILRKKSLNPLVFDVDIKLIGCGSAYYACLYGSLLDSNIQAILASEYKHINDSLVIAISQSGETADTINAIKQADKTQAIINNEGSTLDNLTQKSIYLNCGREIAVASTKCFTAMLAVLNQLFIGDDLSQLPIEKVLENGNVKQVACILSKHKNCFVIGRGLDLPIAMEYALKLKECAYIHAEAQAGGELKHGSISLIENGFPVIALVTQPELRSKMLSNIEEVKARGAMVIAVGMEGDKELEEIADYFLPVPECVPTIAPILATIYGQLLAYHAGMNKGINVDRPRNLAKSVTVE